MNTHSWIGATARLVVSTMVAALFLVIGTGPSGCGGPASSTAGRRITLDVEIAASPESTQFTNARGWSIALTKAIVATGPVWLYEGEPLFAARSSWLVRTAFAHPGHYAPGAARGEMLTPWSVDLLAGGVLGSGEGVTGLVRSATFGFASPPAGPFASELGANVVVLEGTASKDEEVRVFRAEIGPDDLADAKGAMHIEGCPFEPAEMQSDGTVTITVKLPLWFDHVAFDDVPSSADGAPVVLGEGVARNQLVRGIKGALAYVLSYAPGETP